MRLHWSHAADEENETARQKQNLFFSRRNSALKKRDKMPKLTLTRWGVRERRKTKCNKKFSMENAQSLCTDRKLQWLTFSNLALKADCFVGTLSTVCSTQFLHDFEIYAIGWQIVFRAFTVYFIPHAFRVPFRDAFRSLLRPNAECRATKLLWFFSLSRIGVHDWRLTEIVSTGFDSVFRCIV